jgi:hypothetical protein
MDGKLMDFRTRLLRPCVSADRISLGTDCLYEEWVSKHRNVVGTLLGDLNQFWLDGGQSVYGTPFEPRLDLIAANKPDMYWCIYHLFENHDTALWMIRQLSRGVCSTGVLEEFIFMYDSRGVNGKGTILALLMATLGMNPLNYYKSIGLEDLTNSRGGNTPELAACRGRRQVTVNEAFHTEQRSVVLNPTNIKKLISLDDPVSTTAKYKDPDSWKPQCLLIIATNSAPRFPAQDGGCQTRMAFLNMPFKFVSGTPANDSERAGDADVKLKYMPACVPEFLFWAPRLVQGMLLQRMGRHLEPRPAQIAADTAAAFSASTPTDILLRTFDDLEQRAWGAVESRGNQRPLPRELP